MHSSEGKLCLVIFVEPSKDGGTTWAQASTVGTRRWFQWRGVAMSSDGSKMAACGYGEIWTSMDTGATWLQEATFDTDICIPLTLMIPASRFVS